MVQHCGNGCRPTALPCHFLDPPGCTIYSGGYTLPLFFLIKMLHNSGKKPTALEAHTFMAEIPYPFDTPTIHQNAWRLFRILAEFVTGFDTFTGSGPFISIFGSARLTEGHRYYQLGYEVAQKITEKGFSIITGSGPGIMEAANKAAKDAKRISAGLIPDLPHEPTPNNYLDPKFSVRFRYFFVRKVMFVRYAQGFVFLPGGYGTLDELFEILTLVQTQRTLPVPIYLMGADYWHGLISWIQKTMTHENCVNEKEWRLFTVTDDPQEVATGLFEGYQSRMKLQQDAMETM
jgi:uncharacterized protein (TIGR00730 family)